MDVPHGACINEITVDTAVVILSGCWVHTRVHGGQRFHGVLCSGGCWGWPQHAMGTGHGCLTYAFFALYGSVEWDSMQRGRLLLPSPTKALQW